MYEGPEIFFNFIMSVMVGFLMAVMIIPDEPGRSFPAKVNAVSARPDGNYDIILESEEDIRGKTKMYTCPPATANAIAAGKTYKFKIFRNAEVFLMESHVKDNK